VAAVTIASLLRAAVPPDASILDVLAPVCGIALGAFLAGKLAKNGGLYHGAIVGVGYVLVEAIGLAPSPFDASAAGTAEGLAIIAGDALVLALAALAGWIAAPEATALSFSGKGRGR
jgi:hypothetical protein